MPVPPSLEGLVSVLEVRVRLSQSKLFILWVAGVLDRALMVRIHMDELAAQLTTLDRSISESLWALGFNDTDATACLLQLPQGEDTLEELRKCLKTPTTQYSHPKVRHLVGVWLSSSTIQYAAAIGQRLLAAVSQGGPPQDLMDDTSIPSHPTSMGSPHREPINLPRSSQQLVELPGTGVGSDTESRVDPPALAGGLSSDGNTSAAPISLGAGGADLRAGFCGTASLGALQGASPGTRMTTQPLGAEFCAPLPAVHHNGSSYSDLP